MAENVAVHGQSTTLTATQDSGKALLEPIKSTENALHIVDQTNAAWMSPLGPLEVIEGADEYEAVGTSASDQALGGTGAAGDYLSKLIVQVGTAGANGVASIKDGAGSSIPIVPSTTPIGVYVIHLGIRSVSGAWKVTTGSAATALAIGKFTA